MKVSVSMSVRIRVYVRVCMCDGDVIRVVLGVCVPRSNVVFVCLCGVVWGVGRDARVRVRVSVCVRMPG